MCAASGWDQTPDHTITDRGAPECQCRVSEKALYFERGGYPARMRRRRHTKPLLLTEDERRTLEQWARRPKTAQRLALRSRMILACAEGLTESSGGEAAARVEQ